jgi:type III secretory pathway component EscS
MLVESVATLNIHKIIGTGTTIVQALAQLQGAACM